MAVSLESVVREGVRPGPIHMRRNRAQHREEHSMSTESAQPLSRLELMYTPLGDYLRGVDPAEDAVLTFAEIEAVIGRPLPDQARVKHYWWESIPRQPQSRAWLRADRRAEVDLSAETVTFVWEVFVRNNPLERIQEIRSSWLGYARTSLAHPPRSADDPHVELGWWEPHQVYVLHLPQFARSEEHTSELQSLMRISYAVLCLNKQLYHLLIHIPTQI